MIHNNDRYPTFQQELLLKATFLEGKSAVNAWEEWRMDIDIDRLDRGSFLLLPLLYRKLNSLGIKDQLINKMKGVHRYTWYNNQTLFRNMAKLVDLFHKNGIQTMVIKGAALSYKYYEDLGLRPTGDFDVLIKPNKALFAVELLKNVGWQGRGINPRRISNNNLSIIKGRGFNDVLGQGFDLHWHLLPESCHAHADNEFWNRAISFKFCDISTRIMCPTDLLLHACIEASRANKMISPIRYLADIMTILNFGSSNIEWCRLIDQASRLHIILPVRKTLKYVKSILNAPVPMKVLYDLNNTRVSKIDIVGNKARCRSGDVFGTLLRYWSFYLYQSLPDHRYSVFGFIKFMKLYWGLKYNWQVPLLIIFKGVKQLASS